VEQDRKATIQDRFRAVRDWVEANQETVVYQLKDGKWSLTEGPYLQVGWLCGFEGHVQAQIADQVI
jgi:hypothetical protein